MSEVEDSAPDVAPRHAREILILAWLLLFGGRWLLFPILQATGALTPQQMTTLDNGLLLKLYLALLALTLMVFSLTVVRHAQAGASHNSPSSSSGSLPPRKTDAPAGGDEIRD